MKVLTITLHSSDNPGSSLQAFALQHFLLGVGHDTEIIDYRPNYVATNGAFVKTTLKKIIFFRKYREMIRKNNEFIDNYLKLNNKRYTSYEELKCNPPKADVYITGSDQLWNSNFACGRDKAYYLGFVKRGKKMSYAVSLGKETISREELEWIYTNVKDFDFISVREYSSKNLLEEKSIAGASYVCDPVLLVDKRTYLEMQIKPPFKKYVAVYLVVQSELLEQLLQALREKYGYEIILVGAFLNRCKCDKQLRGVSPCEFLGLLANADFVVASSFHATVFAQIFEKNFAIIPPKSNSARIEQFLEITNLQNHIVKTSNDIEDALKDIDYTEVNTKLNTFVAKSKKTLLDSFDSLKDQCGCSQKDDCF